jgi:hypothetical protein
LALPTKRAKETNNNTSLLMMFPARYGQRHGNYAVLISSRSASASARTNAHAASTREFENKSPSIVQKSTTSLDEEGNKARVVIFVKAGKRSFLKYPKSLPAYDVSNRKAGAFIDYEEAFGHIKRRLKWSNDGFQAFVCAHGDDDEDVLARAATKEFCQKADCFVIVADEGECDDQTAQKIEKLVSVIPTGLCVGTTESEKLKSLERLQFMPMKTQQRPNDFFELPFETRRMKDEKKFLQMKKLFERKNHLDLLFMILVLIDSCEIPGLNVPEVAINQEINLENIWCIASNCGSKLLDCYKNPQCMKSLNCIDACGMNDQVCTYTCLRSYQNREFEYVARCMLHSHNCLGNDAKRPEFPIVKPMTKFRGEPLTHETAEKIMQGWLGTTTKDGKTNEYSWLAVAGQNPAYDHFPAQYQIWYNGKARNSFWYNPVFKVNTLDGKSVWRRSDYRCKREKDPGTFTFTFMDNGVTSKEFWRIVDAADDLSWALYYYAGAAKSAGQMYVGAVLATPDGLWPPISEMPRVEQALWEGCGCKMWEMMEVDNRPEVIANAPLQPLHDVVLKPSLI